MAIGTISSPATWLLGTVAAPSWFQNVQDNINSWIAGTGPTVKSLQIDGVGGATSTTTAGALQVSGTVAASSGVFDNAGGTSFAVVAGAVRVAATSSGTSGPTPTFLRNTVYKESITGFLGTFATNGAGVLSFIWGMNYASLFKNATGTYFITCNIDPTSLTNLVIQATAGNPGVGVSAFATTNAGHNVLGIQFYDTNTKATVDPLSCSLYVSAYWA